MRNGYGSFRWVFLFAVIWFAAAATVVLLKYPAIPPAQPCAEDAAAAEAQGFLELGDVVAAYNPALTPTQRYQIGRAAAVYASAQGLDPAVVLAVIVVESSGDPGAVSPKGAVGLMQVMPWWPVSLGEDEADLAAIDDNIRIGTRILGDNVRRWGLHEGVQRYFWGNAEPDGAYLNRVMAAMEAI